MQEGLIQASGSFMGATHSVQAHSVQHRLAVARGAALSPLGNARPSI